MMRIGDLEVFRTGTSVNSIDATTSKRAGSRSWCSCASFRSAVVVALPARPAGSRRLSRDCARPGRVQRDSKCCESVRSRHARDGRESTDRARRARSERTSWPTIGAAPSLGTSPRIEPSSAALVVMGVRTRAVFERALRRSVRQLARSWYMFFFQLPVIPEWALKRNGGASVMESLRRFAVDPANFSDEELRPLADAVQRPGVARGMINWYRTAMRQTFLSGGLSVYRTIQSPTLLIWGMEDRALGYDDVVPGTEKFVRSLRIEQIQRGGHFIQQERPDEVNRELLAFLTTLGTARREREVILRSREAIQGLGKRRSIAGQDRR